MATSNAYHHGDLRNALLRAGEAVLTERGAMGLSLREVARRIGVSHNAPFKHFPSREALLATMAQTGFEALGATLAAADGQGLRARADAYVRFALSRPALFRLMFSGEIDRAEFPELAAEEQRGIASLTAVIEDGFGSDTPPDAVLSAWAFVHGLARLLVDGGVPPSLRAGRSDETLSAAVVDAMANGLGLP